MKESMNFSRRSFLTGAASAGALAAMGALAGCAPKAPANEELAATGDASAAAKPSVFDKPASVADQVARTEDYDVVVVGGGNSGVVGALELAQLGAKTLLIEQTEIGRAHV